MDTRENENVEKRIRSLSSQSLREMLTAPPDEFTPFALEVARAELIKRDGRDKDQHDTGEDMLGEEAQVHQPDEDPTNRPVRETYRWFHVGLIVVSVFYLFYLSGKGIPDHVSIPSAILGLVFCLAIPNVLSPWRALVLL